MSAKGTGHVPHVSFVDMLAMIWRERRTAAVVALAILALGGAVVFMTPRTYEAKTRLLIRMGQEYVFQPRVGASGAGAAPQIQEVVNAELRLLASPELARRTIARVGLGRLYPDLGPASATSEAVAERAFARDFSAEPTPNAPVISLAFSHRNRTIAAQTLDALTAEYMAYRRSVLGEPAGGGYAEQSRDFTRRAETSAAALQAFLAENDVADFDGAMKSATELLARLDLDRAAAAAERGTAEGRAASLRQRIARQPAEIELYAESDAGKRLVDLGIERQQLLAHYQPDAAPVVEIERRIAQVQTYIDAERRAGLTRRGPNPVRQALETELYQAEADVRAQSARETAIGAQKAELAARVRKLEAMEPRYRELTRDRQILDDNARAFTARAEETRAFAALQNAGADNISRLEPARAPLQGKSYRLAVALLTLALSLLGAIAAALVRGLRRMSFPTPSSAARTLDAPVLGIIEQRRAA